MVTGTPTPISGLPTGTIDNLEAIFPMDIGMPGLPQTIQASILQVAQFLQSQGQMISGSFSLLDGMYQPVSTGGWLSDGNLWTYASGDDPSYSVAVNANVSGTYGLGTRIKFTQHSADKYFMVTQVTVSGTNTYLNLYGGTDYDVSSSGTISNPNYSYEKAPYGFPLSPEKWTVTTTNTSNLAQATPTALTWYNVGSMTIYAPIGAWRMKIKGRFDAAHAGVANLGLRVTLSTANNSESDTNSTINTAIGDTGAITALGIFASHNYLISVVAKTLHYLNLLTGTASVTSINIRGDLSATVITAESAYL